MTDSLRKDDLSDITYSSYLQLERILDAQDRLSGQAGKDPAHDEMLFIITHQAYELWFKLILFEMDRVQEIFAQDHVPDTDLRKVASALKRIVEILKLLGQQLDVLETMTPLDFLDFRGVFRTASGFQSIQFREVEVRLGLRRDARIEYAGCPYDSYLPDDARRQINTVEKQPSLFDQLEEWLARTPFVEMGGFKFWDAYRGAVADMIDADREAVENDASLSTQSRKAELEKLDNTQKRFDYLLDGPDKDKAGEGMNWRLSHRALQAALFINLYRDQPVLQGPFSILRRLMDIDELLAIWRYRHALMVQRMLGVKMGSGGSSGHDYLMETTQKHRIFKDLFALSTFLIPRSALPELPDEVTGAMGFSYMDETS